MPLAGPSRRAVLLGGIGIAVAGCEGARPTTGRRRVDPDDAVRAAAVADIRSVLAAYDANLAAFPTLSSQLAPLRSEHEAHLRALGAGPAPSSSPTSSSGSSSSSSSTAATPSATVAPSAATAPVTLATREQAAAEQRLQQVLRASPSLARLLAGIGASEASHAALLRRPA